MLKKDVSYATRVWDHYELCRQCLFLTLGLITLIGLTFSSAKAENTTPKIPFKSVDDQMTMLTEKLKLTPEQESEVRPIIQDFSEKRQALFQKYQGKGRGAYRDLFSEAKTLNEEMKSKLKPILTTDQIEAYTKLREEQRSEMREELKNLRKNHSDQ